MYLKTATPLEKIHYVVQLIAHKQELAPAGTQITITEFELTSPYIKNPLGIGDFRNILDKLAKDEQVVRVSQYPTEATYNKYTGRFLTEGHRLYRLITTEKFEAYRQKIQAQYDENQKNQSQNLFKPFSSLPSLPITQVPSISPESKVQEVKDNLPSKQDTQVSIRFEDMNRYILLNDYFLIAQPAYDSENYRFFDYVWHNPNRTITLNELNQKLEAPLKKPLAKIIDNLNFRGPLKDAFFQVSKTSVCFTPNRSIEDLTQAGLYPLRLFSTQKAD